MLFSCQRLSYGAHSLKALCTEYLNNFINLPRLEVTHEALQIPWQRTQISKLQHSTSHSVNVTHLKLVLCHDAPSQAFLFQFISRLFLSIYQNERKKTLTYHSLFCYQSGFPPVCILYFLLSYCIYFPCQTHLFHWWLLL